MKNLLKPLPTKRSSVSKFKGFLVLITGVILIMLGLGMWRSPDIDWKGFLGAWTMVADEAVRLFHDPFAILGILVLLVGAWITLKGLRYLFTSAKGTK